MTGRDHAQSGRQGASQPRDRREGRREGGRHSGRAGWLTGRGGLVLGEAASAVPGPGQVEDVPELALLQAPPEEGGKGQPARQPKQARERQGGRAVVLLAWLKM